MAQSVHGHQCGASGIVIRSLIRLHQYILDNSDSISSEISPLQLREYSHITLETLARMMAEIARDHIERLIPDRIDSLPLTCSYNMRTMMDFIKERPGNSTNKSSPAAVDDFATLYEVALKRWRSTV
ncbi:hypothetical protein N7481_011798 [Penicillium waksmanii]|uniref:uncharacterized protein n=1 Tax=Penicillium waksmanii TaxID=69791 RepID=UPI0025497E9D|nr:uncharacterized protein N7481_011798 [Penicillium waksmanii]KAJ5974588.1 hypothetical protein N7481_011798 [Penicillium waksmanii]